MVRLEQMRESEWVQHLLSRVVFPKGQAQLALAVSGGPDSVAMCLLAALGGRSAHVFFVNHRLRAQAVEDSALVAELARACGFGFSELEAPVAEGPNLEARARKVRYSVLPEECLVAHTADDLAETVVINILRGTGLDGLSSMNVARRPIVALRRNETHALCALAEVAAVQDEMNHDPRFVRNRVRGELLPLMSEISSRDVVPLLARLSVSAGADARLLDELAAQIDRYSATEIANAPLALGRRAVRQLLAQECDHELPVDFDSIERILQVAAGAVKATQIAGGLTVRRSRQRLSVSDGSQVDTDR